MVKLPTLPPLEAVEQTDTLGVSQANKIVMSPSEAFLFMQEDDRDGDLHLGCDISSPKILLSLQLCAREGTGSRMENHNMTS